MPIYQNRFVYTILNDATRTATLGDGSSVNGNGFVEKTSISGTVDIPSSLNGYSLISLSHFSIRNCNQITELILPHSLVQLDNAALTVCDSLTNLVFPNSIRTFGDFIDFFRIAKNITFERGSKLTSVGTHFLRYCHKLEYLELPSSLISIQSLNCFEKNYKLKKIVYCGDGNFDSLDRFIDCPSNLIIEVSIRYPSLYFAGIKVSPCTNITCISSIQNYLNRSIFCFQHSMYSILVINAIFTQNK